MIDEKDDCTAKGLEADTMPAAEELAALARAELNALTPLTRDDHEEAPHGA